MLFLRNKDQLATSKRRLALPGLSNARKRQRFSLDSASTGSSMRQYFAEGLRFLIGGQRIVGIAKDGMHPAAQDGRLKAHGGSGSRADVDQPSLCTKHSH